jgi:hypothetical protein
MDILDRQRVVAFLLRHERYSDLWQLLYDSRDRDRQSREHRISTEAESAIETLVSRVMDHLLAIDDCVPDDGRGIRRNRYDECLAVWLHLNTVGLDSDVVADFVASSDIDIETLR